MSPAVTISTFRRPSLSYCYTQPLSSVYSLRRSRFDPRPIARLLARIMALVAFGLLSNPVAAYRASVMSPSFTRILLPSVRSPRVGIHALVRAQSRCLAIGHRETLSLTKHPSSFIDKARINSLRSIQSARLLCSSVPIESIASHIPQAGNSSSSGIRRSKVRELLDADAASRAPLGELVRVSGWIRTRRDQKSAAFLQVNDGSSVGGIQVILDKPPVAALNEVETARLAELMSGLTTGASVDIEGVLVRSPGKGQALEILVSAKNATADPSTKGTDATIRHESPLDFINRSVRLVGACPSDTYPLQKKRHSMEFLREMPHFRVRTNTIGAVSRVRSCLAQAAHAFFADRGFVYVQTPIITTSDCEGAGERFQVTTRDLSALSKPSSAAAPATKAAVTAGRKEGSEAKDHDFFGANPAYLTVSGQLTAEAYACALGDVYTFGPTFRAEKSQTTRHLAEFNMLEPEMAFADLHAAMDNAEALIRYTLREVVKRCGDDLRFLDQNPEFINSNSASAAGSRPGKASNQSNSSKMNGSGSAPSLIDSLTRLAQVPFPRISYRQAVKMLQVEIAKDPARWAYPDVTFGTDLQTEHERWLAEVAFEGQPVFVHNYPRDIKAFYMRDSDADPGTVDSFDLLAPGIGEIVGGSQREDRLGVLEGKLRRQGLDPLSYDWYLDLRRYGSVPHSGYGLGFERLVCLVTRLGNIRDAVAFPRYQGYAEF